MIFIRKFFQALLAVAGVLASSYAAAGSPPLLDQPFPKLQDSKTQSLCQDQGNGILVANTASFCGLTGQYEGLESVHDKYLIHRDGARVEIYSSLTAPGEPHPDRPHRVLAGGASVKHPLSTSLRTLCPQGESRECTRTIFFT